MTHHETILAMFTDFDFFFTAWSIFIIGYRTRTVFRIMRLINGFYSQTIIILFIVCLILFCVFIYCYIYVLHCSFFRSRFQIISSFCRYIFHSHLFSTCTFLNTSIYMICNHHSRINVYNGLIESQLLVLPLCKAVECIYRLVDIYLYHLIVVFTGSLIFGLPVFTPQYKIPRSFTIDLFYTRLTIIGFFLQRCRNVLYVVRPLFYFDKRLSSILNFCCSAYMAFRTVMVSYIPLVNYWFGLCADLYIDNFERLYIYSFFLYFQISNVLVLTRLVFAQFHTFVCLSLLSLTYLLCLCKVWCFDILNMLILTCSAFIQFRTFAYSNALIFIFLVRTYLSICLWSYFMSFSFFPFTF